MTFVNIHKAKTHFSKLIDQVLNGEEIMIARRGHPLIKLVPFVAETPLRHGGQFKGLMHISDDFDKPLSIQ